MCGIVGSYNFKGASESSDRIANATRALAHRGPDDEGIFMDGPVALGHRRLSIIDTSSAGKQPFTDESGRYTLTFNGEIYNYKDLREELSQKGHQFRSETDTEVLLKGYMEYGKAVLSKLNGFFAFAIYDSANRSLFLARDRFGIKPLYWAEQNGRFMMASELKALMALGITKELDRSSLAQLIQLSYIPAPWTIFRNCHKLLPGHAIKVDANGVTIERYYDPRTAGAEINIGENPKAELRSLLDKSVERRLVADVPLGSFLSGGIDSSIIAAIGAKMVDGFKTFSIGFPDHPKYDESRYAEEVARHIGSDHTTFAIHEDDLKDNFFGTIDQLDEPFADSSAIPMSVLSLRTVKHIKVALSGDGADEVFSGYRKHLAEYRIAKGGITASMISALSPVWKAIKGARDSTSGDLFRKLDRFARSAAMSPKERYWFLASFTSQEKVYELLSAAPDQDEINDRSMSTMAFEDPRELDQLLLNDIMNVLPNDMLKKVDCMSMAHGLEVRTPFLDHSVVEFANSLPVGNKFGQGELKSILRSAYRHELPEAVFNRPKQGFEVPLLKWFQNEFIEDLEQHFSKDRIVNDQIFDPNAIEALLTQMKQGKGGDIQATIYALLVFQLWWKKNIIDAEKH